MTPTHGPARGSPAAILRRRCARLALAGFLAAPTISLAMDPPASPPRADFAVHVAEVSQRFGLPETWIEAVIAAESAGDPQAVSRVGAMGLMQIMPATWADLRGRYGLGHDPFHPRDNIVAGSAYLRELHDRYGAAGFLAAYNAGPGRYERSLATGRPLPAETRAYVAKLAPMMGVGPTDDAVGRRLDPLAWTRSALFPGTSITVLAAARDGADMRAERHSSKGSDIPRSIPALRSTGLFVPLSRGAPGL